jgi:hypothetical protein
VDLARAAELQVLLEGVPLPATTKQLIAYAQHQAAQPLQLDALRRLPDRLYGSIDEVAEQLVRVQPREREAAPSPRASSGGVPGGPAYTTPHPVSGRTRDVHAAASGS